MFKKLPAFAPPDALLTALAVSMNDGKAPLSDVKDSDVAFGNLGMPAGYICLGQFVDHDMTLDKTPLTQQQQDPRAMTTYDTPRFDLASVYGRGPAGSPELYDPARPGYLLCNDHDGVHDLPRDDVGAAYLGDPRNDENLIVVQFHAVFLRRHNRLRDEGKSFEQAQQLVRWHYQWLIVNDYLRGSSAATSSTGSSVAAAAGRSSSWGGSTSRATCAGPTCRSSTPARPTGSGTA